VLLFEGAPLLPIFGMLLFVKQRFVDQIQAGTKTWEIRYGARYRNVRPGDSRAHPCLRPAWCPQSI
jgi:hypothetical protein